MTDTSATPTPPELAPEPISRSGLAAARRIVVKIGTNVLCRDDGELALGRAYAIIEELVDAHRQGREVIVVSSGSIGLGRRRLPADVRPDRLVDKQACAAIGQTRLMTVYQQAFERFGIATAQILLTEDDFSDRGRYLNLRNTLSRLLELRAVPIVNENDTVSTTEIETHLEGHETEVFGDNDVLSALVAAKLDAELLIILSDVDGLHDASPELVPGARRIPLVREITPDIERLASGGSRRGRGGMRTKLRAAKIATHSGTMVVVARGAMPQVVHRVLAGEDLGTFFAPRKPLSRRKRWIGYASTVAGRVVVNRGARDALVERGASLLFAGVVRLESRFSCGAIVSIVDEDGVEFARGIVQHSSDTAQALAGRHSKEIAAMAPPGGEGAVARPAEFVHRDTIVILRD